VIQLRRSPGEFARVGHRGASALAPENTLRAFELAVELGCDMLEFDVIPLADRTLVLAHSNDLGEVSHGAARGRVGRRTLDGLRQFAPDLPTLDESGLKSFEVGIWHGLYAPKGTPKPVIDKLSSALQQSVKDETVRKRFADLGADTMPPERATPEALRKHLKAEIDKWGPLIKKAGVYAD